MTSKRKSVQKNRPADEALMKGAPAGQGAFSGDREAARWPPPPGPLLGKAGGHRPDRLAPLPQSRQWLYGAAALLFVAWVLALNFRPVIANDFWIHLRVGEDILHAGQIPRVDDYSAIGRGRPFLAHEWLGAVAIAEVVRLFGALGPTLLREAVALGIVALLFGALPASARRSPLLVPLLALCVYLTSWRLEVRPDLLTMLLFAAFVFAAERWRRTRRLWDLVWLVPLEVLWTNLHGAFLYGVVFLWGLTGCVVLAAALPWTQRVDRAYSWTDAAIVLMITIDCTLAPLLNPYGTDLIRHTISMSQGHDFDAMRTLITEWHPPFAATSYFRANFPYMAVAFAVQLALLWAGLLLRLRARPLVDVCIAASVTWLGVSANRFIPFAAIAGFPIAVRCGDALLARVSGATGRRWDAARVRPLVECAVLAVILWTTIGYGYVLGPGRRSALGWGYGGRRPVAEVAYIRDHHLQGTLYVETLTEGSFIVHELYPAVRPVMDARVDFVGEKLYLEYEHSHDSGQALLAYLHRYDAQLAIVNRNSWMAPYLVRSGEWNIASQSDERVLLVRR